MMAKAGRSRSRGGGGGRRRRSAAVENSSRCRAHKELHRVFGDVMKIGVCLSHDAVGRVLFSLPSQSYTPAGAFLYDAERPRGRRGRLSSDGPWVPLSAGQRYGRYGRSAAKESGGWEIQIAHGGATCATTAGNSGNSDWFLGKE